MKNDCPYYAKGSKFSCNNAKHYEQTKRDECTCKNNPLDCEIFRKLCGSKNG